MVPEKLQLHTKLCDLLGIRHPVVGAPMLGATTPALVAAVSGAGGLGILAGTRLAPDALRQAITAVRAATDRPFGVNFLLAGVGEGSTDVAAMQAVLNPIRRELGLPERQDPPAPAASMLADQFQVCLDERVPVLSFAMGNPAPYVERAHAARTKVLAMVTSVASAHLMVAAGVDVVVAQGYEAGGHRSHLPADEGASEIGTLTLAAQVAAAVSVPVVAAGGIMDGGGLAAALALGAAGASLGTRLLLTAESGLSERAKVLLCDAAPGSTSVTTALTGRPARAVRNHLLAALSASGTETLRWPLMGTVADDVYAGAASAGRPEWQPLYAGQGLGAVRTIEPAAEVVRQVVAGAAALLGEPSP